MDGGREETSPLPVIINRRAGGVPGKQALAAHIEAAFRAVGLFAAVEFVSGDGLAKAVRAHAATPLIVVGGGDGTLGTALSARRGHGAIGILPLGTRNHLARDLGIPAALRAAAAVIASGVTEAIDLGTVNGLHFVNNASVGLYPLMVRRRDAAARGGLPKWAATIPAAWAALGRLPYHRMHLHADALRGRDLRTPLLLVANNRYALDRGHIGQRASLTDGTLSLFAVAAHSRRGLLWLGVRALFGAIDPMRDFAVLGDFPALTVRSRAGTIDVALDGEVHRLKPPLRFASAPASVTVCVPPPDAAATG